MHEIVHGIMQGSAVYRLDALLEKELTVWIMHGRCTDYAQAAFRSLVTGGMIWSCTVLGDVKNWRF